MAESLHIDPDRLKILLAGRKPGYSIHFFDELESTSATAIRMAIEGAPAGTIVISSTQTGGVGRFGRRWHSPRGGLWFSLVARPAARDATPLTLITGASVSRGVEGFTGLECGFHWPNDIFFDGAKAGGVLLQSRFVGSRLEHVVAGIGINANFSASALGGDLLTRPATLLDLLGREVDLNGLLSSILGCIEEDYARFEREGPGGLIKKYASRCVTLGRQVRLHEEDGTARDGTAIGLTGEGGLVVDFAGGKRETVLNAYRLTLPEGLAG